MASNHPVQVLTDARSREVPWPQIVKALGDLTGPSSLDVHGRPWIEVAAQLTGYTTNQLRAAQRTYAKLESFITENKAPDHALNWPMSNLEVVARIAKANPDKALEIICGTESMTWRDLQQIYEQLRHDEGSKISSMSAGHHSARMFAQSLFDGLSDQETLKDLLGGKRITGVQPLKTWPGRYPYAHPNFVVGFHEGNQFRLAAFEGLRFYGDVNLHLATKAVLKAAVEASFFAKYYWCLSGWTPTEHLKNMKDKLGLDNVGLISFGEEGPRVLFAPTGEPQPNRQAMLFEDGQLRKRLGVRANAKIE
ncbi:hypothetical protein [Methylobacterium sp. CM6247]